MTAPAPPFPDDVEVAIVSHNGRATLPRVFDGLDAAGVPADRVLLVDIASTDDTVSWLAADRPAIRVERLAGNVGPNPARNLAIERARRPFLLLLDSDAYVRPETIATLRSAMQPSAGVGAVVPIVVHEREPNRIQYSGAALHFMCEATSPWPDRLVDERGRANEDIGTAPGLCALIDVAVTRAVGPFDERYFMGKDDGEFWYRLRVAGYRLVESPAAVVLHGSRPRSTWLFPFQIRNRWHFMLKNYELATLVALTPAFALHEPLQFAMLAARGQAGAWFRAVRGLWSWLPSIPADRRAVHASRKVHDRHLLSSGPLSVRADMVGGSAGQVAKRAYDGWLGLYWRLVTRFLP